MEKTINNLNRYIVYADILAIFRLAKDIRWDELRTNSVYRILYLSSVLYSFRYPEQINPFLNYRFTVNGNGPFNAEIRDALVFLLKDDYVQRVKGDDILILGTNSGDAIFETDTASERYEWLKDIMFILAVYTENKIYDFIFRDPEYQMTIKSNTQRALDTDPNNDTIKTLESFKAAFEETLKEEKTTLSSQRYLELYFEYVFSRILKRQD